MSQKFIEGKPDSLDAILVSYNPGVLSSVSSDEVRTNVCGYTETDSDAIFGPLDDNVPTPKSIDVYCYFPMDEESVQLRLGFSPHVHIALSSRNYGFPDDVVVNLKPTRMLLTLSDEASIVYERIVRSSSYNLNNLLEAVGFVVNDSMEYDFDKIIASERELSRDITRYEAVRCQYIPTDKEVMRGICSDAGKIIRAIFLTLNVENRYGFTFVGSHNGITAHDSTVVFDKETGRWAIINSKSYAKEYNLVPLDKVGEFGTPYVKSAPHCKS